MSNPKLALIPSGYKNSKVYSILPNDGSGDFTFARNSGGTRVNKQGLIEQMQTYGSQLLNNSDFTSTSDWTVSNTGSASSVIENGYLHINTSGDYSVATQAVGLTAGDIYRVDYEILENTAGTISIIGNGGASTIIPSTVGKHTIEYDAQSTFAVKRTTGSTNIKIAYIKLYKVQYNTPRLDWSDSNCPSLLLEPQSTNLITYSEDFSQWTNYSQGTGSSVIITQNNSISPEGKNNATRIQCALNSGNTTSDRSYISLGGFSGTPFSCTKSLYVKNNLNVEQTFFIGVNSVADRVTLPISNEWQRLSVEGGVLNTEFRIGIIGNSLNSDSIDIDIFACQLETGNLSSYIPTYAGTSTRLADTCTGAGDATIFNDSEGVLYAEISGFVNGGGGDRTISISDGSQSNSIQLLLHNTANRINFRVRDGGSLEVNISDFTFQQNQTNKIACKYKLGDYALWINGEEKVTTTIGNLPSGLSVMAFDDGALNDFYGKCKDLRYYDTALTDAELTELTT